jgi:hypothetical protein
VNDRDDHDVVVEHVRRKPIVMQDEGDSFAVRREKDRGFGTPACGATRPLFALVRVERRRELCEGRGDPSASRFPGDEKREDDKSDRRRQPGVVQNLDDVAGQECEINTEEERTEPVCGERRPFEPEACDLTEGE